MDAHCPAIRQGVDLPTGPLMGAHCPMKVLVVLLPAGHLMGAHCPTRVLVVDLPVMALQVVHCPTRVLVVLLLTDVHPPTRVLVVLLLMDVRPPTKVLVVLLLMDVRPPTKVLVVLPPVEATRVAHCPKKMRDVLLLGVEPMCAHWLMQHAASLQQLEQFPECSAHEEQELQPNPSRQSWQDAAQEAFESLELLTSALGRQKMLAVRPLLEDAQKHA